MKKGVLKYLAALAVLGLVCCILPLRADAATAAAGHGFVFAMDTMDCADHSRQACEELAVSNVRLAQGNLSFSYRAVLACGCEKTGEGQAAFSCTQAYSGAAVSGSAIRFSREAGHSVSGWIYGGNGTHTGSCALCGAEETKNCSGDSAANCTVAGTCTACGGSYLLPDAHAYSWQNDGTNHWQECANNRAHKISEGTCAVGTNGSAATCEAAAVCGTCGKSFGTADATAHAWGGWTHGEVDEYHKRTCALNPAHTETLAHDFDYALGTDDAGHLYGTCKTCGYMMEAWLELTEQTVVYKREPVKVLKLRYSGNWLGQKPEDSAIVYTDNVNAGEATGTVTVAGVQLVRKFTITPKRLTITSATARNRAYDGTDRVEITDLTVTGVIAGDDVSVRLPVASVAGINVGTYDSVTYKAADLTLTGTAGNNYEVLAEAAIETSVVISQKEITASIKAPNRVYGKVTAPTVTFKGLQEQDKSCVVMTYEGTTEKIVDGEKVKYQGTAVPTEAGSYTVKVTVNSGNYKLTGTNTAAFKITKAPADYDAPKALVLSYNGEEQALLAAGTIRGNRNGFQYKKEDDKQWGTAIPTAKNAGTDVILWKFEEDENHLGASGKVEVEIDPASLTVIPDEDQEMTYGGTMPALTYKVKGAIGSEKPAYTGALTVTGVAAGKYEIKQGTLKLKDNGTFKAANYKIVLEKVEFVIKVARLTVTAKDQTIICGTPIDKEKFTITELAEGDVATVTLTPSTTGVTYGGTITPAVVIENEEDEDAGENYYIVYVNGELVIEPDFAVIEDVTTETVNHTQEEDIKALLDSLNSADTDDAVEAQREKIRDAKETCAALLEQIKKSTQAMETDAIGKTSGIMAENVKLADETVIKQAIADLEKAKTEFAGNYSPEDLKRIGGQITQLEAALEVIGHAQAVIRMLSALPVTVTASDAQAAEVRVAYNALSDYEKELVDTSDSGKYLDAVSYKIISGNGGTWERGRPWSLKWTVIMTGLRVSRWTASRSIRSSIPQKTAAQSLH